MDLGFATFDTTGLTDWVDNSLYSLEAQGNAQVDNYLSSVNPAYSSYGQPQGYVNGYTPSFFDTFNSGVGSGNGALVLIGVAALLIYALMR